MSQRIRKTIFIKGMTCIQCEKILQKSLLKADGIYEATVNYKEGKAYIQYDSERLSEEAIKSIIAKAGYEQVLGNNQAKDSEILGTLQVVGMGLFIGLLYLVVDKTIGFNAIPELSSSMSYGMLFVIGLLTSLHCIAMCGGINLSQCLVPRKDGSFTPSWKPSAAYNAGRVISYTVIGAMVGGIGSAIGFSGSSKGIIAILAGVFMMIMGINMLDIFPQLKGFSLRMPSQVRRTLMGKNNERGPFVVGLLNGFMPCGPLQAMQLYALGTGSATIGALSMFFFSLGTVPLMLGFGFIATLMGQRLTKNMMKFSAVLVVGLGFIMAGRGLSLSGVNPSQVPDLQVLNFGNGEKEASPKAATAKIENELQVVTGEVTSRKYPVFIVEKGTPLKLNFHAEANQLNGCNKTLVIPDYNIQIELQPGDNIVEFTPQEVGTINYTCWMGMISSRIEVLEKIQQ